MRALNEHKGIQRVVPKEERKALSRKEMAAALGIGLVMLHKLINEGRINALKCGKRTLFLASEPDRFLASLPKAG